MANLVWESVKQSGDYVYDYATRAKVPGGWIVRIVSDKAGYGDSITFFPDPDYKWE
ncbi:MAG: hypothetical protein PHX53_13590 [Syntrophales bacterium]|nr:hypothetical protein [Syntrophales bacterium]